MKVFEGPCCLPSEQALAQAIQMKASTEAYQNLDLRIYLCGKNCGGFEYGVTFDQSEACDLVSTFGELKIIMDPDTAEFAFGARLEWVDDERGQGFLVENPRHKRFRGKFYKKKYWQERLNEKRSQQS